MPLPDSIDIRRATGIPDGCLRIQFECMAAGGAANDATFITRSKVAFSFLCPLQVVGSSQVQLRAVGILP